MKTIEQKVEEASNAHYGQKLGTPTDFTVGAKFAIPLAMKEGYMEAMDYFARRMEKFPNGRDGGILFDLAEYGKKIGILKDEEIK